MAASAASDSTESDTASLGERHAERRGASRRRVLKGGIIAFNDHHSTLPCAVRDISGDGAHLRMTGSVTVPDSFDLIVELDGLEVPCAVIWRKGTDLGVRFAGPLRKMTPKRSQTITPVVPAAAPTLRRRPR